MNLEQLILIIVSLIVVCILLPDYLAKKFGKKKVSTEYDIRHANLQYPLRPQECYPPLEIPVVISEEGFKALISGKYLIAPSKQGRAKIILSDIGFERMIKLITEVAENA